MRETKFIVFVYYNEHTFWKSIHTASCSELDRIFESAGNYNKFDHEEFDTYEEAKASVSGFPYEYCQCDKCKF